MEVRGTAASGYSSKSSVACRSAQLARSFCTCHRRAQSRRLEAGFCYHLNGKWLHVGTALAGSVCARDWLMALRQLIAFKLIHVHTFVVISYFLYSYKGYILQPMEHRQLYHVFSSCPPTFPRRILSDRVRYLLSATMYYRTLNLLDRRTNRLTFSTNL